MIISALLRWLIVFIFTVTISLMAAFSLAAILLLGAERIEATRLLLSQRASVERFVDRSRNVHADLIQLQTVGEHGTVRFRSRQAQLKALSHLFKDDDLRALNRSFDLADELLLGSEHLLDADPAVTAELLKAADSYISIVDDLLHRIKLDSGVAVELDQLAFAIGLIVLAWITAIGTLYVALFRLSYGYDLFMRNYMEDT